MMMKSLKILFLLMFLSTCAFAEKLDEIVIFEDSLAITEGKAVSNVEVVSADKIQNLNPSSTADLLKMISGVTVKGYDAKHVNVDMGGYGAEKGGLNSVILLNGRRISSPDMSGVDWSFIPVDNVERVEVYKGGNSVLFGDRATGGAINIVTKKPIKSGVNVKTEAGSYGMYHGNLSGQYADKNIAFLLDVDKYNTDGYRDNSELETSSISGDLTYYQEKFELNAHINYSESDYGLPGSVTKAMMEQNGRDYSDTPRDGGDGDEYLYGVGAKFFLPVGELNIKSDFRKRNSDYTYYTFYYHAVEELKSKSINPFYTLNIDHKGYSNRFTAGLDYIKYDVENKSESAYSSGSFEIDRTMTGYYLSDRANINGIIVEGGYRLQKLKDDYKSDNNNKDESENAYNLLLGYEAGDLGSFYVRYDKSFRFPTTDELREYYGGLNTDIQPQTAQTYELGYTYKYNNCYAGASAYTQTTDNEIFTNPSYVPYSNENIDTKRKGGELKIGYNNKIAIIEGVYSYVKADIDEGVYEGNEIPLLSKHQFKTTLGYKTPVGVGVYYFGSYYSSTYAGNDYSNTQDKLDAYYISDLKIDYEYKRFSVYAKVNNLFNEKYYDYAYRTAYSESYYPAAERNFAAGLTFRY